MPNTAKPDKPRRTDQKKAVREVFEQCTRPLSVPEVLAAAQASVPALGIATVYRHLRTLCESGWLVVVELPGEPPRYERAGIAHHHHFRCDGCKTIFDVPGCAHQIEQIAPAGFAVSGHEVLLYGLCPDCNQAPIDFG